MQKHNFTVLRVILKCIGFISIYSNTKYIGIPCYRDLLLTAIDSNHYALTPNMIISTTLWIFVVFSTKKYTHFIPNSSRNVASKVILRLSIR